MSRKYQLIYQYDGSNYHGSQSQKNTITVQDTIESALAQLFQTKTKLFPSGRTDQGVHALFQSAHFITFSTLEPFEIFSALNGILPKDIRVLRISRVAHDFHARFSALLRQYQFFIYSSEVENPLLRGYALYHPGPLNVAYINDCLSYLIGEHEFYFLCQNGAFTKEETRRFLLHAYAEEISNVSPFMGFPSVSPLDSFSFSAIRITLEANGFLRKMVRMIVGTCLKLLKDGCSASLMKDILERGPEAYPIQVAKPHGLYLTGVFYEGDLSQEKKAKLPALP